MPLGKAIQQHRLLPEVSQASITKRPGLALIPNTNWVFFRSPNVLNRFPSPISLVPPHYLIGRSSEMRSLLSSRQWMCGKRQHVTIRVAQVSPRGRWYGTQRCSGFYFTGAGAGLGPGEVSLRKNLVVGLVGCNNRPKVAQMTTHQLGSSADSPF